MGQLKHSRVYLPSQTYGTYAKINLIRAVIFSDSKAAILSAGSIETVISTEAKDSQVLIRQIKAKHKQIVLQWIPGHSQITGNVYADTLAKKGAKITQTFIRETY